MKDYATKERDFNKINLNMNENPFEPDIQLDLKGARINRYQGTRKILIKKISEYTKIRQNKIFIGAGCDQLLDTIGKALVEKDTTVALLGPMFPRTELHMKLYSNNVDIIDPQKDLRYNLNIDKDYDLVIFSNPNNPTGYKLNAGKIEKIIKDYNLVVIDETLSFYNDKESFKLIDKHDNLIILRSFSKNFGLASERIGFGLCSNEEILSRISQSLSPYQVSLTSQLLAEQMLNNTVYLDKYVKLVKKELSKIKTELNKLGLWYTDSESSNIIIDVGPTSLTSQQIVEILDKKYNIKIVDAKTAFSLKGEFIRVSIGLEEENNKFISALKEICQEHNQ